MVAEFLSAAMWNINSTADAFSGEFHENLQNTCIEEHNLQSASG